MNRHFTRDEAEALLPTLRPLLERLRGLHRESVRLEMELRQLHWKARGNGHDGLDETLTDIQRRREAVLAVLGEQVDRIHAMGVLVKDLEIGLVDFPWIRGQQMAYLCWKVDEPRVEWWHEVDAGFAGRQRLEE